MKIGLLLHCTLLPLLMAASVCAEDWTRYYPLVEGATFNYWVDWVDPASEDTDSTFTIIRTYEESGHICADYETIIDNPYTEDQGVVCWLEDGIYQFGVFSPPFLLLPRDLPIGVTMTRDYGVPDLTFPDYGTVSVTIEELIPSMTVIAGTFSPCIKVRYDFWSEVANFGSQLDAWFALDVGLIRSSWGIGQQELTWYDIPGGGTNDPPDDDYPDTPAGAAIVGINDSPTVGSIATPGDVDFFQFSAISGVQYTIATGGTMDTYLVLYDGDETTLLAQDDDGGAGVLSSILWTCQSSGTYYVGVMHDAPTGTGDYTLSVAASLNMRQIVWVNFAHLGTEDGTREYPYDSLAEAVDRVSVGGTIRIVEPTTIVEPILISKPLRIDAAP